MSAQFFRNYRSHGISNCLTKAKKFQKSCEKVSSLKIGPCFWPKDVWKQIHSDGTGMQEYLLKKGSESLRVLRESWRRRSVQCYRKDSS